MSVPDWGLKRICPTCTARFYDMRKHPIVCPKCGGAFDVDLLIKKRRGRPPASEAKPIPIVPELEDPLDIDLEGDLEALDEGDDVLEDTSDFGEEDDAVVVIEHIPSEE